jgi:hypothetical protein
MHTCQGDRRPNARARRRARARMSQGKLLQPEESCQLSRDGISECLPRVDFSQSQKFVRSPG